MSYTMGATRFFESTEELVAEFGAVERYEQLPDRHVLRTDRGAWLEALLHGDGRLGGWAYIGRQKPAYVPSAAIRYPSCAHCHCAAAAHRIRINRAGLGKYLEQPCSYCQDCRGYSPAAEDSASQEDDHPRSGPRALPPAIRRSLKELSEQQRAVLVCVGRGLSIEETAAELGYHRNTIKYQVARAKEILRLPHDVSNGEAVIVAIVRGQIPDRRRADRGGRRTEALLAHIRGQVPEGPFGAGLIAWLDEAAASWPGAGDDSGRQLELLLGRELLQSA